VSRNAALFVVFGGVKFADRAITREAATWRQSTPTMLLSEAGWLSVCCTTKRRKNSPRYLPFPHVPRSTYTSPHHIYFHASITPRLLPPGYSRPLLLHRCAHRPQRLSHQVPPLPPPTLQPNDQKTVLTIAAARRPTASWWPTPNVLTQQLYTLATTHSTTSVLKRWKGHTSCESKDSSWSAPRCLFNSPVPFHACQRHAASPHASRGWDPQGEVHT
jgi:hypothetical protein